MKRIDNSRLMVESMEDTEKVADAAASFVFPGLVVFLYGELGSGKTFFACALSKVLGAKDPRSPSFTLVNEYEGKMPIAHVDLYRTEKSTQTDLDLLYYQDNGFLILIEWPERLENFYFDNIWSISMDFSYEKSEGDERYLNGLEKRIFSLSCNGSKACSNMKRFANCLLSRKGKK